jgi:hypothetical protein
MHGHHKCVKVAKSGKNDKLKLLDETITLCININLNTGVPISIKYQPIAQR